MLSISNDRRAPEVISCEDLGATVYPSSVPDGVAHELEGAYGTLPSTIDWFVLWEGLEPTGVCILDEPRHVLVFHVWADTLELLNKCIVIEPADVSRACTALFRSLPHVRRIRLQVPFQRRDLHHPAVVRSEVDYMIVDLPATFDQYLSSLGSRTRANLRSYENRLRRDFPQFAHEVVVPGDTTPELADLFLRWKLARFARSGQATYWETEPEKYSRFVELVRRRGEALTVTIEGRVVAVSFAFWVGGELYGLQSAFDPSYEKYHLGILMTLWLASDAITRGAARFNMGLGSYGFKEHLGAKPVNAQLLSVYRSQIARLRGLREAPKVVERGRRAKASVWRLRRAAKQWLQTALHGLPRSARRR